MALQGNLRDFSATEILQLLGSQKKTGCLLLEWNSEHAVVYVIEGRIVSTRNPGMSKDDPLLKFLLKVNRLSDEQHRGLTTIHRESGRDLEDLLVNGRYLEADELAAFAERQVLDDLSRIVRWEDGAYRFDPNARWPNPPLLRLSIEGALIEAARRVDEQKRFVTVFRDPYQLLGVRDLPDPNDPLSEEERELFGLIDGQHTVEQIAADSTMSEYETYEALHRMLEAQWIEITGRRDPGVQIVEEEQAPAMHPAEQRPWWREVVMGAACVGIVLALRLVSGAVDRASLAPPAGDVFAVAAERDLRTAIELFRRDRGSYPRNLDELVEERWIERRQTALAGYALTYHRAADGSGIELRLEPAR